MMIRESLTSSCSQALELSCLVSDLLPGDEVILPSYTFSSTANSVVLRGAIPVFVDIDDYLCLDIDKVIGSVTERTKMVITVHYAGCCNNIQALREFCEDRNIVLVEDVACKLVPEGTNLGVLVNIAVSLHSTKNLGCGEGGFLIANTDDKLTEIEHATKRNKSHCIIRGEIDNILGFLVEAFLMSDFTASFCMHNCRILTTLLLKAKYLGRL